MPLWPGIHSWENYQAALVSGVNVPVATMLFEQSGYGDRHRRGQNHHLALSAFAIVYFRFPGRNSFLLDDLPDLMLPVEVRIVPTFEVVAGLWHAQQLFRPDLSADRLGHRNLSVSPVFPDHPDELAEAARVDGARPMRFFWDIVVPDEPHKYRGALCDPVYLWLEPIPLAAADHHRPGNEHHRHGHQSRCSQSAMMWRMAGDHGNLDPCDDPAGDRGCVDAEAFHPRPCR